MVNLEDKTAIVTGGASGLGLATVQALVDKGAKVVLSDVNEAVGKSLEKEFKDKGADVTFIFANVAEENSVQNLINETVKKYGKLDIMINNAGIAIVKPTEELTYDEYKTLIAINQDGMFLGSKYAIIAMLKSGGGSVVNVASILGHVGAAYAFCYNASKGAVNIFSKSLAAEYATRNIRVNTVCPGYVDTGMVNPEALGAEMYDGLVGLHPMGRLGKPEEIAHGIIFLCENEFCTGSSLIIDGGYTAV